ncbi:Protein-disulfide isomerase [Evansella caseinilytica]|uniref:Protein-disulfide isomerase n=1 Tax=Evansella caseinilytica TaxID=1503961 RepID=A0A1H3NSW4_9BACI|nr:thioredoxin domain-containing protein [Evansella caseinilytica]SDY91843.1 Protein-disulfide isomerase [Evansella caseinilytica]
MTKTRWYTLAKGIALLACITMSGLFLYDLFTGNGDGESNADSEKAVANDKASERLYNTVEFTEGRVFLGNEAADNEVILVIDYACPYCKEWLDEIFVPLKEQFIDQGEVKFYTLPQVYLSKETLALTEFTQKVESLYPERYFELLDSIYADHESDHWGSEEHINDLSDALELTGWSDVELDYDVIRRTRQVTRGLEVDTVPTVYINGRMVQDRMDYEEIVNLIENTEIPAWSAAGELCEQGADDC